MKVKIYIGFWTLKVKCTQYKIMWINGLQKYKGNGFFEVGQGGRKFVFKSKISQFHYEGCPCPCLPPKKTCRGRFNVPQQGQVTVDDRQ